MQIRSPDAFRSSGFAAVPAPRVKARKILGSTGTWHFSAQNPGDQAKHVRGLLATTTCREHWQRCALIFRTRRRQRQVPVYIPDAYRGRKTDRDILPYSLEPSAVVGGWAAYTAPANCNSVIISVTSREWKLSTMVWVAAPVVRPQSGANRTYRYSFGDSSFTATVDLDQQLETVTRTFNWAYGGIESEEGKANSQFEFLDFGPAWPLFLDNEGDARSVQLLVLEPRPGLMYLEKPNT